jgi:hypothetical protein
VLLEVSQLLTTVASPVAAVEEQHGDDPVQLVRQAKRGAVHSTRLKLRELFPNAKRFHSRRPRRMVFLESAAATSGCSPSNLHRSRKLVEFSAETPRHLIRHPS